MSEPITSATGMDGVTAGGNTPIFVIQEATITEAITDKSETFPLAALSAADTVKIDCHMDIDGATFTRSQTTRDRQRMCEKIVKKIPTGETIDITLQAIFDQQAGADDLINAAYAALPAGAVVYIAQAFGLDAQTKPTSTTIVDVYRATVNQRAKNQPVAGEDLMFTATLAGDLYIEDAKLA